MTRIPSDPLAVWIESVVVHPGLRGKGVGKYLMLKSEQGRKGALAMLSRICNIPSHLNTG